ncbi:MAG: hypothetical protein KJP03_00565 [Gammaproteobacteria bacterium]|nr:hypothetical protein [Gammaproteobacteria bacterium]
MNRTLGFFLGSATVFAVMVFVVGQPVSLAPPAKRSADLRVERAIVNEIRIPDKRLRPTDAPVQTAASGRSSAHDMTVPVPDSLTNPAPAAAAADVSGQVAETIAATEEDIADLATVQDFIAQHALDDAQSDATDLPADTAYPAAAATLAADSDPGWYPLWDPFLSELSAKAFARRLGAVTGLDYRVFRTDDRAYSVAVGYQSEEQRVVNVAMIEEATGLSLNGGSL